MSEDRPTQSTLDESRSKSFNEEDANPPINKYNIIFNPPIIQLKTK